MKPSRIRATRIASTWRSRVIFCTATLDSIVGGGPAIESHGKERSLEPTAPTCRRRSWGVEKRVGRGRGVEKRVGRVLGKGWVGGEAEAALLQLSALKKNGVQGCVGGTDHGSMPGGGTAVASSMRISRGRSDSRCSVIRSTASSREERGGRQKTSVRSRNSWWKKLAAGSTVAPVGGAPQCTGRERAHTDVVQVGRRRTDAAQGHSGRAGAEWWRGASGRAPCGAAARHRTPTKGPGGRGAVGGEVDGIAPACRRRADRAGDAGLQGAREIRAVGRVHDLAAGDVGDVAQRLNVRTEA